MKVRLFLAVAIVSVLILGASTSRADVGIDLGATQRLPASEEKDPDKVRKWCEMFESNGGPIAREMTEEEEKSSGVAVMTLLLDYYRVSESCRSAVQRCIARSTVATLFERIDQYPEDENLQKVLDPERISPPNRSSPPFAPQYKGQDFIGDLEEYARKHPKSPLSESPILEFPYSRKTQDEMIRKFEMPRGDQANDTDAMHVWCSSFARRPDREKPFGGSLDGRYLTGRLLKQYHISGACFDALDVLGNHLDVGAVMEDLERHPDDERLPGLLERYEGLILWLTSHLARHPNSVLRERLWRRPTFATAIEQMIVAKCRKGKLDRPDDAGRLVSLAQGGPEFLVKLYAILDTDNSCLTHREAIAWKLGESGRRELAPVLIESLKRAQGRGTGYDQGRLRGFLIRGLGAFGDRSAIDALRVALKDGFNECSPNLPVESCFPNRREAKEALARLE